MNNDLHPTSDRGGEDVVADRHEIVSIEELAMLAMGEPQAPPNFDDVSAAECAAALTDEDRAALAELTPARELVARVFGKKQDASPMAPAAASTFIAAAAASEDTWPDRPAGPSTPAFAELLARHEACHATRFFTWQNQFFRKDVIGRGGQGVVYLIECADAFMGSRALKVMSPVPYNDSGAYQDDMQRMASVAAVVHQNFHDNLIHVERFEPINDIFVMVMRLIDGFDLQYLLNPDLVTGLHNHVSRERWEFLSDALFAPCGRKRVALAPGLAVYIIQKVLQGLKVLHENRIVHGDVKPSNIMLDRRGLVRLIDIGSAFQLDDPPRRIAWSPRYAPPEVLKGEPWTPQGDLASLGYVLIELLSGRPDLGGQLVTAESGERLDDATYEEHLHMKRTLSSRLTTLLPPKAQRSKVLMELCSILVQEDPAKRFKSAEKAIDCTAKFREELVLGRMAMAWQKDIQYWAADVKAVKASEADPDRR